MSTRWFAVLPATGLLLAAPTANADDVKRLDEVTVTAEREESPKAEVAASVDAVSGAAIRADRPTHPSEVLGRMPGVWVNATSGEGHMTAIRQPLTTNAVYLYLEDGVPTRSTGFFNHNALYEINLPQADGVEVIKGPGTVLHGSDAIGGVINVLTRTPPRDPEASVTLEGGSYGYRRALVDGGATRGADGVRADLNLTATDGWRDATGYTREAATVRWDHAAADGALARTVFSASNIDQQTAGLSYLSRADYLANPRLNYAPISYRAVGAYRLSTSYETERDGALVSLTPYARYDNMDILPNWSLSYDPTVYNTRNASLGLLAKWRRDFAPQRTRLILGMDLDYSPGSRNEQRISTAKTGSIYTSYALGPTIYDYDVTFEAVSPYAQLQWSPLERLRVTAGVRADAMRYDYSNYLGALDTGNWRRPASTVRDYRHLSPKLGATWALAPDHHLFAAYGHGFRAPSESQLFRQGSALDTVDLKPVKADNYEAGARGRSGRLSYEAAVYSLHKIDDILNYRAPSGATEAVNAGETWHRGIELGAGVALTPGLTLDLAWSAARHTYEDWVARSGGGNVVYTGNDMETAPRTLGNTRLTLAPAAWRGGQVALEWVYLGRYWMDADNTHAYDGHDLINLRAQYPLTRELIVFARLMNAADTRFAEGAQYTVARGEEYAPGLPRTVYAGLEYRWRGTRAPEPAP